MIKYLICLVLAVFTAASFASENSVVISGLSYHANYRTYTYKGNTNSVNELNFGIGVQHKDIRWVLLRNTYRKWSVAALWVPQWELTDTVAYGLRLGGATGYSGTPVDMGIAPVVGAELDFKFDNIHILPAWQFPNVWTLHMQVDY